MPPTVWLVCLCLQQPRGSVVLLRMCRAERQWPAVEGPGAGADWAHALRAERYVSTWQFVDESHDIFDAEQSIWVFPSAAWDGDCLLVTRTPRLLEAVVASLPHRTSATSSCQTRRGTRRQSTKRCELTAHMLEMFPWLTAEQIEGEIDDAILEGQSDAAARGSVEEVELTAAEEEREIDLLAGTVAERLAGVRHLYAEEDEEDEVWTHFYWFIPGGEWTRQHKHKDADQCQALARAHAKDWAWWFQWPKHKGFTFNKYEERHCVELAKGWARAGNFYFGLWLASGEDWDFDFSAHSPPEPLSWLNWACELSVDEQPAALHQVAAFRSARPVLRKEEDWGEWHWT